MIFTYFVETDANYPCVDYTVNVLRKGYPKGYVNSKYPLLKVETEDGKLIHISHVIPLKLKAEVARLKSIMY